MPDPVSNYKLFMARAVAQFELERVTEFSADFEKDKAKIFTTSNPARARSMRSGPGSGSGELTITVDAEGGNFQVPWYQMLKNNEIFALVGMRKGATAQIDFTLVDCEITSISDSHTTEDGESTLTISFDYLEYDPEE